MRLLIEPHDRQLARLNIYSNKLKKLPKRARNVALRLLSRQIQKREQLRSLRVVVSPQVLQQAYHHLNHDTAEQSSSQQNTDSYIYRLRSIELNSKKYRDYSHRTWLNSFMLWCRFWCSERALRRAARYAGQHGTVSAGSMHATGLYTNSVHLNTIKMIV